MFERLTHRSKYGIAYTKIAVNESNMVDVGECYTGRIIDRLAAYEDSGLSPEEVQELAKAKADGRLKILPAKPGDIIYRPEALQFCWVIANVEIYEDEIVFIDDSDNIFRPDDIGKTVFLTREEAEKALGVGE
jgi:hypothetical protein